MLGTQSGKGNTLDKNEWAFHKVTLPPGKYNVPLYLKAADGKQTTLIGGLTLLDQYGIVDENPKFDFYVQEHDVETRKEAKLVLLKPQTLIFRIDGGNDPQEYTVGIEKDTD